MGINERELKDSSFSYRFGFQGQEGDDEVAGSGNSYTAEYWQYDSRLGRRWNLDPIPQIHISDYAAFANSPVVMVDINGDKVDLSKFLKKDKKNDTKKEQESGKEINYTESLKADLEEKTGLTLSVDEKTGILDYKKDENGKAIVSKDGNTSSIARDHLVDLIDDKVRTTMVEMIDDKSTPANSSVNKTMTGSAARQNGDIIFMHVNSINNQIANTSSGLDNQELNKTTLGFAMTFLHESYHSSTSNFDDVSTTRFPQGPTVYTMNRIRKEMGPSYGVRLNYKLVLNDYIVFGKQNVLGQSKPEYFPSLRLHVKF
jgi:hypothetical protein